MTAPAPDWVTLEELKNDQTLDANLTPRDDEAVQRALHAVKNERRQALLNVICGID